MDWLLLRGLTRDARHWGDFSVRMQRAFPGSRIVTLDLPGCGLEFKRKSPSTIRGIMEDVRERARNEGLSRFGVLGVSLGGMTALEWSAKYPDEIESAVIVNSSSADTAGPWARFSPRRLIEVSWATMHLHGAEREQKILESMTALRADLPQLAKLWAVYAEQSPMAPSTALRQLIAGATFLSPSKVTVPLLFITSLGDAIVNPECSRRLASRYGADIRIHPHAGHELDLDVPDWLIDTVSEWLGKRSSHLLQPSQTQSGYRGPRSGGEACPPSNS